MWINFLHSTSTLSEFCQNWHICQQTVMNYVTDVNVAILLAYKNDDSIISAPSMKMQHLMKEILKNTNETMVDALLYLDGTHKLTVGRNDKISEAGNIIGKQHGHIYLLLTEYLV